MSSGSWRRIIACTLAALLLAACAGSPPIPDDHYYRLTRIAVEQTNDAPRLKGVLKVDPVKAYGIYRERALLYSRSEHPEELRQHRYHYWIDTPSRLIRDQLVAFLRASEIADGVAGSQLSIQGDLKLKLSLKHFERVIGESAPQRIRVALEALLLNAEGEPLMTRRYQRELEASDSSIAASVRTFNRALHEIYRDLLKDLRALWNSTKNTTAPIASCSRIPDILTRTKVSGHSGLQEWLRSRRGSQTMAQPLSRAATPS
jgi:ABC-type uncharacterized transport system auxiliary subunit